METQYIDWTCPACLKLYHNVHPSAARTKKHCQDPECERLHRIKNDMKRLAKIKKKQKNLKVW